MSTIKERIEKFNSENRPFDIFDFEDGKYGLSLSMDFSNEPNRGYRQEAFDQYALSADVPVKQRGLYTYGSGHDWERVFIKVFEHEKALEEVEFDSEAGGFYCRSNKLEILEELGQRFRAMCEDKEKFKQIVVESLTASFQEERYHADNKTVKYYLQDFSRFGIQIVTRNYHFVFSKEHRIALERGKNIEVYEKNKDMLVTIATKKLYNFKVNEFLPNWDKRQVVMKATLDDDTVLLLEDGEDLMEG